jgi:hypothetical protein
VSWAEYGAECDLMSALISFSKSRTNCRLAVMVLASLITAFSLWPSLAGQVASNTSAKDGACSGLHAGILVEFVRRNPPFTQPPYVMISFILLNDDDKPADTSPASWKVIIDGQELDDSGVGSGLGPIDGWKTLNPGAAAEFSRGFQADRYFPESHTYKVSWRGAGFQSPTITVTVPANRG